MSIEQKLDRVLEQLSNQSVTLAEHTIIHKQNAKDLKDHIKRTNLLESKLERLNRWMLAVTGGAITVAYLVNHFLNYLAKL